MFLKKIIINGFKSFSDKQEVIFDKGISVIVGPNGCGKSNIVDAINWVLGEHKTSSLRANTMTDVIFKGTEDKKGIGRAEVRMVLVNDDNKLPIEFNEVEVSRIIYASGDNEYYINREKVRRKDINELFYDTGLGKSAYSSMEQGKIDMILSNKPEDRRYIIEEAAGITKYKSRKTEALNKLKRSEENILRVQDILKEVTKQYETMKVQADKARKYTSLHDSEIKLEIELSVNRILQQKKMRQDFHDNLDKFQEELDDVKEKIKDIENEHRDKMIYVNELENKKIDNQRVVFNIEGDIKVKNTEISMNKKKEIELSSQLNTEEEKIFVLTRKIQDLEEELESVDAEKYEIKKRVKKMQEDNDQMQASINELDSEKSGLENKISDEKNNITGFNQQLEEKREELRAITDEMIVKIEESLKEIDINTGEINNLKGSISSTLEKAKSLINIRKGFIDDIVAMGSDSIKSSETFKKIEQLKKYLEEIYENVDISETQIKKYLSITDMFIGNLFSPEGVMQRKKNTEAEIQALSGNVKKAESMINNYLDNIDKINIDKEKSMELLSQYKINISTMKEKENSIEKDAQRIQTMKKDHENSKIEIEQKIRSVNETLEDLREEIDELDYSLNKLESKKKEKEILLEELDGKIQKENTMMSDQQKYLKEINDKWMKKQTEVERYKFKIEEAEEVIKNIYETFYENFSINLEDYENQEDYISQRKTEDIRGELKKVKSEKMGLGHVNLLAIEECSSLEERYNLLTVQLNDLDKAKSDLMNVITELNTLSEKLFLETFEKIRENFYNFFKQLFGGGNAEIKMTDPSNVLETGIDITANPPGQKAQSITLLSGGQRTMTAIALMFATFKVKPSPFCLMDEIDANLDDANVKRFVNLLADFKQNTQFIIITHDKVTMQAADIMYGVTQERGRGLSRIVSAKFTE